MRIQAKVVHFRVEHINNTYRLSDANIKPYEDKDYKIESWLIDTLCPGTEVLLNPMKIGISLQDFTNEALIWLAIICIRISPYSNRTNVPCVRA